MSVYIRCLAVLTTTLLATAFQARALASGSDLFQFSDLKKLVVDRDLRSVDSVLPLLPPEMRSNFALMYRSRSLQQGVAEAPRAILFNRDASLVMSFNNSSQRGVSRFEIMTFDRDESRFDVKVIQFAGSSAPAVVNEAPTNCFGCHGRMEGDLRPVWDPGLIWRGAFGSHDDAFPIARSFIRFAQPELGVAAEAEAYAKFVNQAPSNSVYRFLDLSRLIGQGDRAVIENRPNLRLGLLLMRQQAMRLARLLDTPKNAPILLKRLRLLMGCSGAVVPRDDLRQTVVTNLTRFMHSIYGAEFTKNFLRSEAPSLIDVVQVADDAGIDANEIPLTVEKSTSATFDGSFAFKDLLIGAMAQRVVSSGAVSGPVSSRISGRTELKFRSLVESPLGLSVTPALANIDALGEPLAPSSVGSICQMWTY